MKPTKATLIFLLIFCVSVRADTSQITVEKDKDYISVSNMELLVKCKSRSECLLYNINCETWDKVSFKYFSRDLKKIFMDEGLK